MGLKIKAILLVSALLSWGTVCPAADSPRYPCFYKDKNLFTEAIDSARAWPLPGHPTITGLTLPHHLLARDLISQALATAAAYGTYRRIIILSPDHYSRGRACFNLTKYDFDTILGPVKTDTELVDALLKHPDARLSTLFSHEHGVRALLPFIAHWFPQARVVPMAVSSRCTRQQCDALAALLAANLDDQTLVLQSTDFSHYLTPENARRHDQETLRLLCGAEPEAIFSLSQPDHLDSIACQYLQEVVQRDRFGARLSIMANRNSQAYVNHPQLRTTSYIVQLYADRAYDSPEARTLYFAGDAFFGRQVEPYLKQVDSVARLVDAVSQATGGAPLILNLEGVVMDQCPAPGHPFRLCMTESSSLPLLQAWGVRAVSLANNHTQDFGLDAYGGAREAIEEAGLKVLEHSHWADSPEIEVMALNTIAGRASPCGTDQAWGLPPESSANHQPGKPRVAFLHWGREYTPASGADIRRLQKALLDHGVDLVIGCHSHRAGRLSCDRRQCTMFSLGNFLFDQAGPQAAGKLLGISMFKQGTYALREIPIPNLFDVLANRPFAER